MKINIYYGGRGLIEDPTIYVINKLTEVLEELHVNITRYNLYEQKNGIAMLPNTLKEVDGVILAVHIEWFGIGGFMQQFLDACWLYADKEKLKNVYMMPVVMANTSGEKDAQLMLEKAWELLGGISCNNGLAAYVANHIDFETNTEYGNLIENSAENLYRIINKKLKQLPSSSYAVKQNILCAPSIDLTPQESEQLSVYVSDDTYVKKQKEDIEELTEMFKGMLQGSDSSETKYEFIKNFRDNFQPQDSDFRISYAICMSDTEKTLVLEVDGAHLKCYYGQKEDASITATTTRAVVNRLVNGRTTFQGAFMSGELKVKGDFKTVRTFDQVFRFKILP